MNTTISSPNDCHPHDNNVISDMKKGLSLKIDCGLPIIHAESNSPSPVLKRENSKSWTSLDFNLYEKELSDQMKVLDQQNNAYHHEDKNNSSQRLPQQHGTTHHEIKTLRDDKKPISRALTNCRQLFQPLSPTNCCEWNNDQMTDYESELMVELKRLMQL